MRNGTYLFLCMLLLALVLGGCAGTRHSFQTTPTQEDGIVEEAGTETLSERAAADLVAMLPLEMTLIERNSFAKGMTLPEHLSSVEATTREYEIGDFGYWNAGPDLAIFYDDIYEQTIVEVVPLGHAETGTETMRNESGTVRLELASEEGEQKENE